MCGIIGYIGPRPVVPIILDGLKRLEYRGYDSAGIAVVKDGVMEVRRSAGKLANLEQSILKHPLEGDYGLGHTRWATHGRPTEENAHPHRDGSGRIVVVHNGIIENYLELKRELVAKGHRFESETDTEVVAHLVQDQWRDDGLEAAVLRAMTRMRGLFALVLLSADDPNKLVAVRNGPPIVVGLGDGEYFVASDVPAILAHTRNVVFMDDREMVVVTSEGAAFRSLDGEVKHHVPTRVTWDPVMAEKAGFKHFMLKEIVEQPHALRETILGRVSVDSAQTFLEEITISAADLAAIDKVTIVACGTSWHAALVGKFMIEELARIPVEVDYGSEFRYRDPLVTNRTLAVAITQSGETADTLAALREAKGKGARSLAICNVVGSMATREAEGTIYTHAGPEIGVASTKAFTTQLVALYLLALKLAEVRQTMSEAERRAAHRVADGPAQDRRGRAQGVQGDGGGGGPLLQPRGFPVPRPRRELSDCTRRRAQAEGDFLHPRRGLSGRRDEAWPDRAHRRGHAGGRDCATRPGVREDAGQHPGGKGAWRLGDCHHHRGRSHLG